MGLGLWPALWSTKGEVGINVFAESPASRGAGGKPLQDDEQPEDTAVLPRRVRGERQPWLFISLRFVFFAEISTEF